MDSSRPWSDRLSSRGVAKKKGRQERLSRPRMEELEARLNLSSLVVGAAPGSPPTVKIVDSSGTVEQSFLAYEGGYRGGVSVASGDVTGDGVKDIITGRQRGRSEIKVFDGVTFQQLKSFLAFGPSYRGGAEVAFGHFGKAAGDIVVGMARGGSVVKVFDGQTFAQSQSFTAFGSGVRGVHLAVGNLDNDPDSEIIVGSGPGGTPVVKGFDPATGQDLYQFVAGTPGNRSGVELTTGDFDGNKVTDLATAPDGRSVPVVSIWTRGTNGPELVKQFQPFGQSISRGLELGTLQPEGSDGDQIGVSGNLSRGRRASALRANAVTGLGVFDGDGQRLGTLSQASLGRNGLNVGSGTDELSQGTPIAPADQMHIIDYSPTWPFWSVNKPTLTVTKFISSTEIEFTFTPTNMPWRADLFKGAHLYDVTAGYYYGNGTIKSMTGNTPGDSPLKNTLTLTSGGDIFQPSIVGHKVVIANDQLSDSDFYNSAFKPLWNTPRYTDTDNSKLNDLQLMQKMGVTKESNTGQTAIRLYDWGVERGFSSTTSGTSEHLEFLNAVQAAGLKVIVPVSNFFLGDENAWAGAAPDANYSPTTGIPQAIQNDLTYFLRSISADGKGGGGLHPAIAGIEVGNEIELNAGKLTGGDMTKLAQRTLWWIVNIQQRLQSSGAIDSNDPNHIRFTTPFSNADEDVKNVAKKSWFEVVRNGAKAGEFAPLGPPVGTKFNAEIKGLESLKGADWYKTWIYNSYQVAKRGGDLINLLDKYNAPRGTGDWNNQWPGEAFPVPLVLMELDSSITEAGSEGEFFNWFANDQVQVAENFLRGEATLNNRKIENTSLLGYALFEFNQEPNKTLAATPDSEQTRGILKYYKDRDVNHWRTPTSTVLTPITPLTQLPGRTFAPFQYPIYELFSVTSDDGVRLVDKIQSIIRAPRKK
ncbi:hypothetical protein V5E97_27180 [Singulisphaera sp. Ch08]|uniref:VCBS repeat-containing protein n=1 Tax=Singulisphaera sp. Ch08 TaxID=3120278 RepID=A0AAU7CAL9_9BACT